MTTVHTADHYESQRNPQPASSTGLLLPRAVYNTVRAHGESTYPHECCGILLGTVSEAGMAVEHVLSVSNTRLDSAHNRYNIEPGDLLRAQREGRARGLDIVGFYHSHPDHPAFWSPTDLAEAHWFGCAYVITSVEGTDSGPKAHVTNSFLLAGTSEDDKALVPQTIKIV